MNGYLSTNTCLDIVYEMKANEENGEQTTEIIMTALFITYLLILRILQDNVFFIQLVVVR